MGVSELLRVNTTDIPYLVDSLLALIMGYRLCGSKEATLTSVGGGLFKPLAKIHYVSG